MTEEVYSQLPCRYINYYLIVIIRVCNVTIMFYECNQNKLNLNLCYCAAERMPCVYFKFNFVNYDSRQVKSSVLELLLQPSRLSSFLEMGSSLSDRVNMMVIITTTLPC